MRVTGGKYARRNIACPKGVIRPAMDRMRESLFSILGDLSGISFLDMFSGSGIVAIEAASRNASKVTIVEKDFIKKSVLKQNLAFIEEEHQIFFMSVEKFIAVSSEKFDIIYLDPPFPMKGKADLLLKLSESALLKDSSVVIIHYPEEDRLAENIGKLVSYDNRKYGRSRLMFYRLSEDIDE